MARYIAYRLLLMIPTLLGIMFINFVIVQAAPGGPIEQILSQMRGQMSDVDMRLGGAEADASHLMQVSGDAGVYRGSQGVDPAFIKQLEKQFGFDQPPLQRFIKMIKQYICFDLGRSYFHDRKVTDLILSKLPVSLSLGLWTTLLVYGIGIPLGVRKAARNNSTFDVWSSGTLVFFYAIPSFLLALVLMIFLSGGHFFHIFPVRGLVSDNFWTLSWPARILDYFWHITLPLTAMVLGGLAKLTMLTKNSILEEMGKLYVVTARSKGLSEDQVLWGHVFRNAMLIIIAGFPSAFLAIFFTSSLLIEVLFSLDGLGLMGFEAALSRDYPIMFGTLYILTLKGLVLHLIGDLTYTWVDRRVQLQASLR